MTDAHIHFRAVHGRDGVTRAEAVDPRVMEPSGAVKADGEKVPVEYLPTDALEAAAEVFGYGAEKYAPRNWEKGFHWSRIYAAALRHLFAWFRGEDIDPESGYHHLAHAACCVLMILSYTLRETGTDDRPKE